MARRIGSPFRSTSSVVTPHTVAGVAPALLSNYFPAIYNTMASGATTANNLKSMIAITGAGRLTYLSCYMADNTSRTIRVKVTVDGTAAVDVTSAASTDGANYGLLICASAIRATSADARAEIVWNSSLDISIASSVASESNKLTIAYIYTLEQ